MTIRSEFGLHDVEVQPLQKYLSKNSLDWKDETINNSRAVGIEIELENHELKQNPSAYAWRAVDDGSLRNHGIEWITLPIAASEAPQALYELLRECISDRCCFGPRTSVHVHVNAQDLTPSQVKKIVQIYCIFEQVLYNFVGKSRSKNIYCVPLFDTNLTREFSAARLGNITERWSKYTGLNLIPLRDKGTIEFRHMHGSSDPVKLSRWIRLILRLFDYVVDPKFDDKDFAKTIEFANSTTDFNALLKDVFKEDTYLLKCNGWEDVKEGVISMQQMYSRATIVAGLSTQRVAEAPFYQVKG